MPEAKAEASRLRPKKFAEIEDYGRGKVIRKRSAWSGVQIATYGARSFNVEEENGPSHGSDRNVMCVLK